MNLNRKFRFTNKQKVFSVILIFAALILLLPQAAHADWVTTVVGGIAQGIASVLGWILAKVMAVLIYIAQYNNFINAAAIVNGWVIARDISNMFFVVILLVIAFATILRLENYSYKKWLPKLILMAILINFSKTICGLLIDVAQVIMLTFVNAFKDVAAGGLVDMLGIKDWQSLKGIEKVSDWEVAGAYVLSVIYSLIALITITAMAGMLVMRIIMIWVYVVLSPFAYLLAAFPGGAQYSSIWWKDFTKNLIVGPVLAFFIWLSFTSLVSFDNSNLGIDGTVQDQTQELTCDENEQGVCDLGTSDVMIKFVISIAMLLGGMKIAQEIGGAAAGVAGKISSAGNKLAIGGAARAGKGLGKWGMQQFGDLRDIASKNLGVDLNIVAGERRRREQVQHNRELRKAQIRKNTLKQAEEGKTWVGRKAALLSTGDIAWQNIVDKKFGVLAAGSPGKNKKYLAKIKEETKNKETAAEAIQNNDVLASQIVTKAEDMDNKDRIKELHKVNSKLGLDKDAIVNDASFKDLVKKESNRSITSAEVTELAKKRSEIERIDKAMAGNEDEKALLGSKNYVVADQAAKDAKLASLETDKVNLSKTIEAADKEIVKFSDVLRKNKLSEVQSARADINAKLEGEANKKIANFSNPDQLVGIFKEAEEQHDEGLMAACYKKLAKTGNYNELHRELGIGTGYDGMIKMSERLHNEGKMTEQDSRALIAEIGELAKAVNHFEAFGAMSMNKAGQWEASGKDEQEAAILAEKSKVQVQQFVRAANRLGNGSYRNGEPHDAAHWDLSRSSIALFASKDKAYRDEIEKTGNINFIQFVGANKKNLEALEAAGAVQVAQVIRDICNKAKDNANGADVSNPLQTIKNTIV